MLLFIVVLLMLWVLLTILRVLRALALLRLLVLLAVFVLGFALLVLCHRGLRLVDTVLFATVSRKQPIFERGRTYLYHWRVTRVAATATVNVG